VKISNFSLKSVLLFSSVIVLGTFTIYKSSVLNAQTVSSPLSGKFACLLNANFSGFEARVQNTSTGINALFVMSVDSTGTTGSLVGGINNQVNAFNTGASSTSQVAMAANSVIFSITPNNPTEYMYKLVAQGDDQIYYLALTNGGNTGLFMQAPGQKQTMNGVCQKV
jgi:hypothetical protein